MDLFEIDSTKFKQELRHEIHQMKTLMMGVVISAATATLVGCINLLLGKFG